MMVAVAALIAFAVALWMTRKICDPESRLHVLDHPNERSLHTNPTPRTGGVGILAGVIAGILVEGVTGTLHLPEVMLVLVATVIAGVSFVDDRRGLSVRIRLIGHFACVSLLVAGGFYLREFPWPGVTWLWPEWFAISFAVVYLVWMVNLYNFMDGMDGFAGGMGVIGFGTLALLGRLAGNMPFTALNLVIAFAVGGFLLFNFPPARVFMGDTGSGALGLLAGGASLWGARANIFPFWVALLVFSPFIVDASSTLLLRLFRREQIWQAHRTHYYQRLVQLGWGHRKTVLHEYMLMLACSLSALVAMELKPAGQWLLIGLWCVLYIGLMAGVSRLERFSVK